MSEISNESDGNPGKIVPRDIDERTARNLVAGLRGRWLHKTLEDRRAYAAEYPRVVELAGVSMDDPYEPYRDKEIWELEPGELPRSEWEEEVDDPEEKE